MQTVTSGHHPGWVSTFFMPMTDLKFTDPVGIFSSMHFLSEKFSQYNIGICFHFWPAVWLESSFHQATVRWIKCPQKNTAENRSLSPNDEFYWFDWMYNARIWVAGAIWTDYAQGSVNAVLCRKDIFKVTFIHWPTLYHMAIWQQNYLSAI